MYLKVLLRDSFYPALALRFLSLQAPKVPPAKSVPAIVEGSGTRCAVQVPEGTSASRNDPLPCI